MGRSPHYTRCQDEAEHAYQQGIEDVTDKIFSLIYQTNGEITIAELEQFIEEERAFTPEQEEVVDV